MTASVRPASTAPSARSTSSGPPPPLVALDTQARGRPVAVVTPEGVPLIFFAAPAADRAIALVLDVMFLGLALLAVLLVGLILSGGNLNDGWTAAIAILAVFFVRYGYFTAFEMRGRGATPGKRALSIRVVDGSGGQLTAEAVIVRNLLRELELFVPVVLLVAPRAAGVEGTAGLRLAASAWAVCFALVPLFNARRLRVGDLLAGTMVVVVPRTTLLADVGRRSATATAPRTHFTDAQLDAYGEYELSVLEQVLRHARDFDARDAQHGKGAVVVVAERISRKIGVEPPKGTAESTTFLREYYAALRGRLERRMVLGRRKADKRAK